MLQPSLIFASSLPLSFLFSRLQYHYMKNLLSLAIPHLVVQTLSVKNVMVWALARVYPNTLETPILVANLNALPTTTVLEKKLVSETNAKIHVQEFAALMLFAELCTTILLALVMTVSLEILYLHAMRFRDRLVRIFKLPWNQS